MKLNFPTEYLGFFFQFLETKFKDQYTIKVSYEGDLRFLNLAIEFKSGTDSTTLEHAINAYIAGIDAVYQLPSLPSPKLRVTVPAL